MTKPNVTSEMAAECLSLLKLAAEPIVAVDLAARLRLAGRRESKRRHVRAIIKQLRDNGAQIVATLYEGYWLTDDAGLWRDYLEGRQIDAKKILGETHRRKKMLADAEGQGLLFQPQRVVCGCATCGAGQVK